MNRNLKYIILMIIIALIGYYVPTFIKMYKFRPTVENGTHRYMWLFNDSISKNYDASFRENGLVGNRYIYFKYIYCKNKKHNYTDKDAVFYISIWEFKDLGDAELKNILIKPNAYLYGIKFKLWEKINKELDPYPVITSKLGFEFRNPKMDVNLDDTTKMFNTINTTNYKGFIGRINKMSFSDAKGETLILFKYKIPRRTLFLMYKAKQSFFVIMLNCNYESSINENTINMFNLN